MSENSKRAMWVGGLLLAVGATALFLNWDPADVLDAPPSAESGKSEPALAPGTLDASDAELERANANPLAREGDAAAAGLPGATQPAEPQAWFRGRLRIVKGELPVPPRLNATLVPATNSLSQQESVPLNPRDLSFAVPADIAAAFCDLRLPSFLLPVAVHGAAELVAQTIHFPAAAEDVIVDVEVLPYTGVLFLHDPSGKPLADAAVWTEMRDDEGSSMTWNEHLDADGMLYFDFSRLADFEEAKTITFLVSRPPDVGNSSSPKFMCKDLATMPRPIVLRFASSQQLHFLVEDTTGRPITGATVRVGGQDASAASLEDGKINALQSTPPAENLYAAAPGFVSTQHPISPAAANEQLIVLATASWIVLAGREVPPGGWQELDAEFRFDGKADASSLLGERFQPGNIHESAGGSSSSNNRSDLRFLIRTSFSSEGRVKLDGIYADVPATVTVSFHGQQLLMQRVPIQPGDGAHLIELPPLPHFVPLRGVVIDEGGTPLSGVLVRSSAGERTVSMMESNERGEFDLGVLGVGASMQIGFSKAGYGRQQLEFSGRENDAQSIGQVTLGSFRAMTVLVAVEDGSPFVPMAGTLGVGARPVLSFFGENVEPTSQGLNAGEWLFQDLPGGTLRFLLLSAQGEELSEFVMAAEPRSILRLNASTIARLNGPE